MIRNGDDDRGAQVSRADAVAIVTGGCSRTGRDVARRLAAWGWAIVVVYLDHQRRAEATVAEILAAEGMADQSAIPRSVVRSSAA